MTQVHVIHNSSAAFAFYERSLLSMLLTTREGVIDFMTCHTNMNTSYFKRQIYGFRIQNLSFLQFDGFLDEESKTSVA